MPQNTNITGISAATGSTGITVIPSPTTGDVTINTPEPWQMVVYNVLGAPVLTKEIAAGGSSISLDRIMEFIPLF